MARSAVPKLFWARLKSELGEHLANQASHNVLKIMIAWMIFGSKLLSSFLMSAIYSFLKYLRYRQTPTWESAVVGGKRSLALPGNWNSEPNIAKKTEGSSLIPIVWLNSYNDNLFARMTNTAQEPDLLFWCHAMMSLHFNHVRSLVCRRWLRNVRVNCSTVGLYCVTIAC